MVGGHTVVGDGLLLGGGVDGLLGHRGAGAPLASGPSLAVVALLLPTWHMGKATLVSSHTVARGEVPTGLE